MRYVWLSAFLLTLWTPLAWAVDPPPPKPTLEPVPAASPSDSFVLGTGPVAGVYFPAGGALQYILRHSGQSPFRLWVESTDGSVDNLTALRGGTLDFAIAQSDWQYYAWKGIGMFKNAEPFADLRAVMNLYTEPFTLITRVGSDVTSIADLAGKTVSLGPSGTSIRALAELVVNAHGLTPEKDFKLADVPLSEQIEALCNGDVDVIAFAAAHPNGFLQEATSHCQTAILPLQGAAVESLIKEYPFIVRSSIPGGLYPNIDEAVPTIGLAATLVTRDNVPEESVHALVRAIGNNMSLFKSQHPVFYALSLRSMTGEGLTAPPHPGAARYYQEVGVAP